MPCHELMHLFIVFPSNINLEIKNVLHHRHHGRYDASICEAGHRVLITLYSTEIPHKPARVY